MDTISINTYSLVCYTYILTGIICAIFRWFHMCHPYDKQKEYFYPARRQITFFSGALVLQLPYVLAPKDPCVWDYIRAFYIIFYPLTFSMIFGRYFRSKGINHNWATRLLFTFPMIFIIGLLVCATYYPYIITEYMKPWGYIIAIILGSISTISFHFAFLWIKKRINTFHEQNFSNIDDFPFHFAKQVTYMPMLWMALGWSVAITGSRNMKVAADIIMSLWMIAFVCKILYPQRMLRDEDIEKELIKIALKRKSMLDDSFEEASHSSTNNTEEKVMYYDENISFESVEKEIMSIISQRYAEPDLKRSDILSDIAQYKHHFADDIISRRGFYKLVNLFRLYNYDIRLRQNSTLDQNTTAIICGFKDYQSLCNTRKRISKLNDEETARLVEQYITKGQI